MFWDVKNKQNKINPLYLERYQTKYTYFYNRLQNDGYTYVKPLPKIKSLCWENRDVSKDTPLFRTVTSNLERDYSVEYFTIYFKTDIADLLRLLFTLEMYMLNKNHRIFENTVHSDNDILLLESLHLKFINKSRVYRTNPHADHYYANIPRREALKHYDFNDYELIKTFFHSELEEGLSNFKFFKGSRYFGARTALLNYKWIIRESLKNNKPIVFDIRDIKRDIKKSMRCVIEDTELDIKWIRHYTGFYHKDALDLAPVCLEFVCPFRNFIYLFDKKLLLNGKEW